MFLFVLSYICLATWDVNIKCEGWDPINIGLNPLHLCTCHKLYKLGFIVFCHQFCDQCCNLLYYLPLGLLCNCLFSQENNDSSHSFISVKAHIVTFYRINGILLPCIFNTLCRGTIRQYVEQVLRLWTVLVFPPPLEFSCAHIYSEVLPTHNSHKIFIYTVKNLRLLKFG